MTFPRFFTIAIFISCALLIPAFPAQGSSKGKVIFSEDFEGPSIPAKWHGAPEGLSSIDVGKGFEGGNCLKFKVEPGKADGLLELNLDAAKFQGKAILVEAMVKGDNITQPKIEHLGPKLMVHVKTADSEMYPDAAKSYGTFDWREASVFVRIPYDCQDIELLLGLQNCTGTFWIDKLRIIEIPQPTPPAIKPKEKFQQETSLRGMMSGGSLAEADIKTFGQDWHANLMRYQLVRNDDEDVSTPEKVNEWLRAKLALLDQRIPFFRKYGVKLVLDLHSPPGMRQNALLNTNVCWDKSTQDELVRVWQVMAEKYKDEPVIWAYDLLNEPMENDYKGENLDWNRLAERLARAIRKIDPKKAIIVEPAPLASPGGFKTLSPLDIPNIVYSIHSYQPIDFTHQGVVGQQIGISYPGVIGGKLWNKEAIERELAPAIEFQHKYHVPIYVGEFSVARWAPGDSGVNWLRDNIDIFEANGWNWTYHAFRESDCWDAEMGPDRNNKTRFADTPRLDLLREYFNRNLQKKL